MCEGLTSVEHVTLSSSQPTELPESAVDAGLSSPGNIGLRGATTAAPLMIRSGNVGGEGPIAGSGVPVLSPFCLRFSSATVEISLSWLLFNLSASLLFRWLTMAEMQTLFLRGFPPRPPPR